MNARHNRETWSHGLLPERAAAVFGISVLLAGGLVHSADTSAFLAGAEQAPVAGASFDAGIEAAEASASQSWNAARLTRRSRASSYHDFLRIVWVPPGLKITTLGKPKAKRAFVTATSLLEPPATVDEIINFVGNYYHHGQDFAVMVCRPPLADRSVTDPTLATWPNVLPIIKNDLGDCSASTLTPGQREICSVAERYQDRKFVVYARGLRQTLDVAAQLFRTRDSQNALWDDFGIATAFSGLGFAVWGSSTPAAATKPLSVATVLQRSVVPEYVLKNVTLQEANCHCVQVPDSEALHQAPVDPTAIWAAGDLVEGACVQLPALP